MPRVYFYAARTEDAARPVTFVPFIDGPMVGYEVRIPGREHMYVYMNPTSDSDGSDSADVFIYQGAGDPEVDPAVCFINVPEGE